MTKIDPALYESYIRDAREYVQLAEIAHGPIPRPVDFAYIWGDALEEMAANIPITYVPARNTVLLGLALGHAEVLGAFHIFIGANHLDYSGYPDCRPEFLAQFERLANLATKAGVEGRGSFRIHAPLLQRTKAEIIREGARLGVNYALTLSCYDPDEQGRACGRCDSCRLRLKGFQEAGLADPASYR